MSEEALDEQVERLEMMGSESGTWDLSDNDTAAINAVLAHREELLRCLLCLRSFMWAEGYADQTAEMAQADAAIAKAEAR